MRVVSGKALVLAAVGFGFHARTHGIPDLVLAVVEDLRGETLPYAQYEYTEKWDYPDWGNEDIPRRPDGYVIANTDDRFRVTPAIVDTRPFTASVQEEETDSDTRIVIEVEAKTAHKSLALALWDIPRVFTQDTACLRLSGAERFIPVRASHTDNFCGILVVDIHAGKNCMKLLVSSPPRQATTVDFQLTNAIKMKVFERGDVSTAYLFADGTNPTELSCRPQVDNVLKHYPFDSDEPRTLSENGTLTIEPGKPQRITGLRRENVLEIFPGARPVMQWTAAEAIK